MRDYDKVLIALENKMKAISEMIPNFRYLEMVKIYNSAIEDINEVTNIIEGLIEENNCLNAENECFSQRIDELTEENLELKDLMTTYPDNWLDDLR